MLSEWKVKANRSPEAIEYSNYLAVTFVNECRQNFNIFPELLFQKKKNIYLFPTWSESHRYSQMFIISKD